MVYLRKTGSPIAHASGEACKMLWLHFIYYINDIMCGFELLFPGNIKTCDVYDRKKLQDKVLRSDPISTLRNLKCDPFSNWG